MGTSSDSTGTAEMTLQRAPNAWYPGVHLVTYQVTWFAAIMGGAAGLSWPGLLAAGLGLALHLALAAERGRLLARLLAATVIGVSVDGTLAASGLVRFTGASGLIPPWWMVVLWPSFAALFDDLCRWVVRDLRLALVLGALGGPVAYGAGASFGAVHFPAGDVAGLAAVGAAWAIATGLLVLVWRWRRVAP